MFYRVSQQFIASAMFHPFPTELELPCTAARFVYQGSKAGFEVGIEICSPIPRITKLYGSILASILGPPSFGALI